MAKSVAEQLRELTTEIAVRRDRDATRSDELDRVRDDVKELKNELKDEREARHRLDNELTALKQQFAAHLAQYQERDKRRWGIVGMVIGALLSLASGAVLSSLKK